MTGTLVDEGFIGPGERGAVEVSALTPGIYLITISGTGISEESHTFVIQ